jgi:hypothetical protein
MIEWNDLHEGRIAGVLEFTIERRKSQLYLRRWSVRRDGTPVPGGIEHVDSINDAKAYAAALTGTEVSSKAEAVASVREVPNTDGFIVIRCSTSGRNARNYAVTLDKEDRAVAVECIGILGRPTRATWHHASGKPMSLTAKVAIHAALRKLKEHREHLKTSMNDA